MKYSILLTIMLVFSAQSQAAKNYTGAFVSKLHSAYDPHRCELFMLDGIDQWFALDPNQFGYEYMKTLVIISFTQKKPVTMSTSGSCSSWEKLRHIKIRQHN